jgi:triacylglycerol esterase/lipase EstA (alpha/beta hydrolase family)
MQRARRSATLFITTLLAMVITLAGVAPASAAPIPSNNRSSPVFFVHGFDPEGDTAASDCSDYWSDAIAHFKSQGWSEHGLVTFGYYSGGDREDCTYKYPGTRGTSITTVAKALANRIFDGYSSHGRKVDVVAHSMGGLVIRSALYHVRNGTPDFPPYLYVEDVVTLGTPHDGASVVQLELCKLRFQEQKQCSQMTPGSDFLDNLPETPSSGSEDFKTHWSVVASFDDATVGVLSGVGVNANVKIQYEGGIDHTELTTLRTGTFPTRVWDRNYPGWSDWKLSIPPLQTAYLEAYWAGV